MLMNDFHLKFIELSELINNAQKLMYESSVSWGVSDADIISMISQLPF